MSKSLRSIKDKVQLVQTINRRLKETNELKRGLGYWAAVDAKKYLNK